MVRNAIKPILQTNFLQVAGAVSFLKGLDYHRDRFVNIVTNLANGTTLDEEQLLHEAVAYVNRAGQYFYFAESSLVNVGTSLAIPKLTAVIMFRNKNTAHRSVDKPWNQDTDQLQSVHAIALSEFGGRIWHPKDHLPPGFTGPFWGRAYVGY